MSKEPVDPPGYRFPWRGEIDYELPRELIAQHPAEERDESRLMVLDRSSGTIEHRRFRDLPEYLRGGDLLIANDSRVIPARLYAKKSTGGRVELLVLDPSDAKRVTALVRSSKTLRSGQELEVGGSLKIRVKQELGGGRLELDFGDAVPLEVLNQHGELPLPPYIDRPQGPLEEDLSRYQTVYSRHEGSVAAPTAGLHFTAAMIEELGESGVGFEQVTLHVGPGTFAPVRGNVGDHEMDAEYCSVDAAVVAQAARCRQGGGRLVAVGTTTVRTLESASLVAGQLAPHADWTRLFIRPGHRFAAVDSLITNFHLPGSTLLCLVMAFAGQELIREAYAQAIAEGYRFYSYGDAMLIV